MKIFFFVGVTGRDARLNGFLCPSFKIKFAHGCNFKNFEQIKSNQNHKI